MNQATTNWSILSLLSSWPSRCLVLRFHTGPLTNDETMKFLKFIIHICGLYKKMNLEILWTLPDSSPLQGNMDTYLIFLATFLAWILVYWHLVFFLFFITLLQHQWWFKPHDFLPCNLYQQQPHMLACSAGSYFIVKLACICRRKIFSLVYDNCTAEAQAVLKIRECICNPRYEILWNYKEIPFRGFHTFIYPAGVE